MEFLFTNQVASVEALIVFACILIIGGIFGYDGYLYLRNVWTVFFPQRLPAIIAESPLTQPGSIAPVIGLDAIEPTPVLVETPELILDNPILYTPEGESIEPEIIEQDTTLIASDTPLEMTDDDTENLGKDVPAETNELMIPSESIMPLSETVESVESPAREITETLGVSSPDTLDPLPNIVPEMITDIETPHPEVSIEPLPLIEEEEKKEKKTTHHHASEKKEHTKTSHPPAKKGHALTPAKREKLTEIINNVRTLIARGHIDDARTLIVSGLAIEKNNRELNIIMASIYEREHSFEKAELILKDIALEYPEDIDILTHLATDLAMQHKYEVSYELYKKILALGGEKEEILYTLVHLAMEMREQDDALEYARSYLKQYPHNPEILWLYSQSQIAHGDRREAVETLIKLKNLTPYNQEIADLIQKLVTEEELAGNFGTEK